MKCFIIVILLKVILSASFKKDICERCVSIEQCQAFTNMNRHDQDSWTQQFPCDEQDNKTISVFGFAAVAKGDFVCCPSSPVWGVNSLSSNSQKGNEITNQNSNVKNPISNFNSMNNKTDPEIKPEYGNFDDTPNRGRNPYLYGNQNMPNNRNPYGNQQFNPQNPNLYGGQQNYPNQNMYGNQQNMPNNQIGYGNQPQPGGYGGLGHNVPANPGIYGDLGNSPPRQGFLGNGQIPDNQNIYGGQPTDQNINGAYRPGLNQNPYGVLQNRPTNQYPYSGQQNRPINQNPYNYPQYGNEPSYPASNINGVPWGNQRISPGFQNNPQANVPNEVQPGNLRPGIPSTNNIYPGFQNNPRTRFPNQRVNPGLPSVGTPDDIPGFPNNPQTNLPNQVQPGIINPGLPSDGNQNNISPGYQDNPQNNLPNLVQPGVLNPSLPSIINQNPSYQSNTVYPKQNQNSFGSNGVDDSAKPSLGQECKRMKTSFPPSPETGCCGRDMSDAERVTDLQSLLNMFAPPKENTWNQPRYPQRRNWPSTSWPSYQRRKRSVKNVTTDVSLDNRIAGGRETELDQFPWTVLLKTTFDYSNKVAAFSCGGSLISRRYVLTAGHCVYEPKARISSIEVTLAEYDKRTFPIDCITVFGGGRECVKNILMHAEDVVHHPEYDDDRLLNDIALVRLNDFAPYTRYIRPICLPTINIDIPEFSNLPLAVTGWGRDHQYVTDIKQSTVVHLVPPDDCKKSYPHLSKDHLCAAGRTGEDTCKGDSGGPLMMLYKGSYYVIGVVSGKRADSPCGSKVPSLYTNVFHYVNWIRNTIRE